MRAPVFAALYMCRHAHSDYLTINGDQFAIDIKHRLQVS